jgi:uncharacterized cupredoxin-like copper-binding protein
MSIEHPVSPSHPRARVRLALGAGALAAVAALAVACGGGGASPASSSPAAAPPGSNPSTAAGTPNAAQGTVVPVAMTEFHLQLPTENLAPGTYTFTAMNDGKIVHAIEIDGPGVSDQRTPGVVQPGGSSQLTVTLAPGTYEMYCPVGNHKAEGMDTHFTVGGAPAAPAGAGAPSSPGGGGGY